LIRNEPDFFALASWRQTTRHLKNFDLDQISSEVQAGDAIVWCTPVTTRHTKHDIFWHPYTLEGTVFKKKVLDMGNDGLKLISMGMCGSGVSGR